MRHAWLRLLSLVTLLGVVFVPASAVPSAVSADPYAHLTALQHHLLSGLADLELNPNQSVNAAFIPNYTPAPVLSCEGPFVPNIKVSENCLNLTDANLQGRGQAQNETSVSVDPNNPSHVIISWNDYRRGDGTCQAAYTLNGGLTWADTTVPDGFTAGGTFGAAREYWQGGGDTSVAWDTKGNAYLDCQLFNRGQPTSPNPDLSSAVYVFRSTQNNGASWNFPGRPVVESSAATGANSGLPFEDKPYMTVDNRVGSPFQDRVYVTWTAFAADGTAYIYGAYSSDYGQTFSSPALVSTTSALCGNTYGLPTPQGTCNENQYSQPFTAPNGDLYVAYSNFNNTLIGSDNRNQVLLVKSTDGGQTFSAPVKATDYYDLPDCAANQGGADPGRACVPEKGATMNSIFRAANYPVGLVNPANPSQVVVSIPSYINQYSNETTGCTPSGFSGFGLNLYTNVKTPGDCSNHVLLSVSTDGGATFTGGTTDPRAMATVTSTAAQRATDQYFQWLAFTRSGTLAVSYYDRQYGSDETTGYSDVSLSTSSNLTSFTTQRATTSSMPPETEFPDAQGAGLFFGDYTGLAVSSTLAYPAWSDTRIPDRFACPGSPPAVCALIEPNGVPANTEEVFTTILPVRGSFFGR